MAISWLLIVAVIIDWLSTVILVRESQVTNWIVLKERAFTAIILTLGATAIATLGAAYLAHIEPPEGIAFLFLVIPLFCMSVPQVIWVLLLWSGRLKGHE